MGTKKGTKPRKWSKEEKLKLVMLHLNEKVSLMQIEKEYSVSNGLVSTWVKKYLNGGEDALVSRSGNPYAALHTSKSLSEVERLRLIVAKQEIELARLKKDIGWKELVQTRSTLLAAERIRSHRRAQSKVSGRFSLSAYGTKPIWLL